MHKAKEQANELQELVLEKFSDEKLFETFCKAIHSPSKQELDWMKTLSEVDLV